MRWKAKGCGWRRIGMWIEVFRFDLRSIGIEHRARLWESKQMESHIVCIKLLYAAGCDMLVTTQCSKRWYW